MQHCPKSVIFSIPDDVISMFSGFKSYRGLITDHNHCIINRLLFCPLDKRISEMSKYFTSNNQLNNIIRITRGLHSCPKPSCPSRTQANSLEVGRGSLFSLGNRRHPLVVSKGSPVQRILFSAVATTMFFTH